MAKSDNAEKIVTLKPREELELLKVAKYGSGRAKESALMSLIYYNQNLVKYIVKGYSYLQGQIDHEDLIAEGTIALAKAIDKFDVESKNRFATYAGYWIRQYIQSFIHKDQLVSQPSDQKKKKAEDSSEQEDKSGKFVRERFNIVYYDREYQSGEKDNKSYSLVDILSEDNDVVEEQIYKSDIKIHINEMISNLESLENLIIRLYYGISPLNIHQLIQILNELEKEELLKFLQSKIFHKKNLSEIRFDSKEVINNRIVKKYSNLFAKSCKTKEISLIIGRAEGIIRKLKQKALKKMKSFGKEHKFDELLKQG